MRARITRYFIACSAFWSVCSLWYDLEEMSHFSAGTWIGTFQPPDQLATIALELAHAPCDALGFLYAKPLETFAEYWLPLWMEVLGFHAHELVSERLIDEPYAMMRYLYFGFICATGQRFCDLAAVLEPRTLKNAAHFDQIIGLVQQHERSLAQFEAKFSKPAVVRRVRQQQLLCTESLLQTWIAGVMKGDIDQESSYIYPSS